MDHKLVVDELTQGKEFAKQLQIHLNNPSSSHEIQEILIHNILNSYQKSLSLLITIRGFIANGSNGESHLNGDMGITRTEPQVSLNESAHSEDSEPEFRDPDHKDIVAKRKGNVGIKKWRNQVKLRGDMGFEEALDDGYSWRKYGQKDIFGAKHPRGYYRCTYRQLQGCLATKHVQRTDDDPSIFNMTYQGSHTCNLGTDTSPPFPLPSPSSPPLKIQHLPAQNQLLRSPEILLTFQTGHKPKAEYLENPSFHFPATYNNTFGFPTLDSTFEGNKRPSLIYPATSTSTHFNMSQAQVSMDEKAKSVVDVESELNDIVPLATSSTSFPNADVAFPTGELEFGDNSIFF